jgi:hypothetical protein
LTLGSWTGGRLLDLIRLSCQGSMCIQEMEHLDIFILVCLKISIRGNGFQLMLGQENRVAPPLTRKMFACYGAPFL